MLVITLQGRIQDVYSGEGGGGRKRLCGTPRARSPKVRPGSMQGPLTGTGSSTLLCYLGLISKHFETKQDRKIIVDQNLGAPVAPPLDPPLHYKLLSRLMRKLNLETEFESNTTTQ